MLVARGKRLEYFTILYNSLEGLAAMVCGLSAGSVSLTGFGLDSLIEVSSGAALLWRLGRDSNAGGRERDERLALRLVGASFLALALYIGWECGAKLLRRETAERSVAGIIVAASLIVMPLLAKAKRRVAHEIGSRALDCDSKQADFCAWLSAILLGGLLLNALAGWWWADPLAGLLMVPIIAREGVDGVRGKGGGCDCCGCG